MSFYASIAGYITYRSNEHLEAVLDYLKDRDWINDSEQWLVYGNSTHTRGQPAINHHSNSLFIPFGHYRNLARVTTELFAGATEGCVVTASTDGCFDAWRETPLDSASGVSPGAHGAVSSVECIDLVDYARLRGLGSRTPSEPGYIEWQQSVIGAFHDEYNPDPPASLTQSGS